MTELNTIEPPKTQAAHDECLSGSCAMDDRNDESISDSVNTEAPNTSKDDLPDVSSEDSTELLGKLPPEIGMLLIISGIAGVLLPGPVGTPLLIAGGVTMWPKTFEPIERWFSRRFPAAHKEGVIQIREFISNLQQRFPEESK